MKKYQTTNAEIRWKIFAILFILCFINTANGAEILIMPSAIHPVHRFTMRHLAEELIKRGHSITWFEYGLQKVY